MKKRAKSNKSAKKMKMTKKEKGSQSQKINFKDVEKTIKKIVAEILEVDVKKITPKARFVEDLGMDSMRALEILAGIEKTYKVEVPEDALRKMNSYNKVIELTKELIAKHE